MRRLPAERLDGARMLGQHPVDFACALAERVVDRCKRSASDLVTICVRSELLVHGRGLLADGGSTP